MRSLDVSEENLKNQQNVVSEEVRVNVLNQPYALFEWLDLWENANRTGPTRTTSTATCTRSRRPRSPTCGSSSRRTTRRTTPCWWWSATSTRPRCARWSRSTSRDIPLQPMPPAPDVSGAAADQGEADQADGQARQPAGARHRVAHPRPGRRPTSPATVLLDPILQGDDSSRFYQRLVKEKEISLDWTRRHQLRPRQRVRLRRPMLMTSRTTYKPGHTADEILKEVDAVVARRAGQGVTGRSWRTPRCASAPPTTTSSSRASARPTSSPAFALFRGDPALINTAASGLRVRHPRAGRRRRRRSTSCPPTGRSIDRVPEQAK